MKLNKTYIVAALLGVGVMMTACDKLIDIVPENALTYNNAFETPLEVESALNSAMRIVEGITTGVTRQETAGMYFNGANPEARADRESQVDMNLIAHLWTDTGIMGRGANWVGHYHLIGWCNIIESNTSKSFPEADRNYLLGQAAFFKGYAYFDLGRSFGFAPIVPDNDYEAKALPASSELEVLAKAEEYALKAFELLPKHADLKHIDGTKITNKMYGSKEAAAALLANLYAWRASALMDYSDAERQKDYASAEKYASMLIDGELKGYATLEPSISSLSENTLNARTGKEVLWEVDFNLRYMKTMPDRPLYTANKFFGFPYKHGGSEADIPYTISCKRVLDLYGGLETTDERLDMYFPETRTRYDASQDEEALKPDTPVTTRWISFGPGGMWTMPVFEGGFPKVAPNRAYVKKFHKQFVYTTNPDIPERFINFDVNKVIWRLADLILLRAEVRNFMGKTNEAIADLNMIRTRAKAALYPTAEDAKGDLQFAIFHERERELIYENHRWWDIRRNRGYHRVFLPAAYRSVTDQDIRDGAFYYPSPDDAGEYNVLFVPNKYWFSRQN